MVDYDDLAGEYARHRRGHPEVIRRLLSENALGRNSHVLEVGCGTGNYVAALRAHAGCQCWGIDPSVAMVRVARERASEVRLVIALGEAVSLSSGRFDLVFSVDVIHHVSSPAAYFSEAYRLLRPGGRVCTVTDSEEIIRERRPLSAYFPKTVPLEIARYPPVTHLRELMDAAGFTAIAEDVVGLCYGLTDIGPYRDRSFSALHLISDDAFRRGVERMAEDLRSGPIPCLSRYLLLWGVRPAGRPDA